MSKLGAVGIPDNVRQGLREYERLEGVRRATKLLQDAGAAYLKVLKTAIKDVPIPDTKKEVVEIATENQQVSEKTKSAVAAAV